MDPLKTSFLCLRCLGLTAEPLLLITEFWLLKKIEKKLWKSLKLAFFNFGIFHQFLPIENVNVARFARHSLWDFSVIFKHRENLKLQFSQRE